MTTFTHILCPVDFSNESRRALGYAIALGRRYKCSITGLHVSPVTVFPGVSGYPTLMPRPPDVESLQRDLRACLAPAEAAGISVEVERRRRSRELPEQSGACPVCGICWAEGRAVVGGASGPPDERAKPTANRTVTP